MRTRAVVAIFVLALLATSVAGALSRGRGTPEEAGAAGPGADPAGAPASSAQEAGQASEEGEGKKKAAQAGPKIVRWVCTDRLCGGCDGQCSRHGHVATHKGGHCACTPKEDSALDAAIRKAFEGHEKGR